MPKDLPKVVLGTSSLISLVHGELLKEVLCGFQVVVTETVLSELAQTAQFEDPDGQAAEEALKQKGELEIKEVPEEEAQELLTGRIDLGEATCILVAEAENIEAMISDDFEAMAHVEYHANQKGFDLGPCGILIKVLQFRGKMSGEEATETFDKIADKRDWMGRPIYEYGKKFL